VGYASAFRSLSFGGQVANPPTKTHHSPSITANTFGGDIGKL
jgi:hypothetical protein